MTALADQLWEDAGAPIIDELFGVSIVYSRAGRSSEAITATYDVVNYQLIDNEGMTTVIQFRDYTIEASLLSLSGEVIEPQSGDTITETINGEVKHFQVCKMKGQPEARKLPGGFRWLVHSQEA